MLVLRWQGDNGEQIETRPDLTDAVFTLIAPRSLRTGKVLKLESVRNAQPEVVTALMREFG